MAATENMIHTPNEHIPICVVLTKDGVTPKLEVKAGKKRETVPLDWLLGEIHRVANTNKQ